MIRKEIKETVERGRSYALKEVVQNNKFQFDSVEKSNLYWRLESLWENYQSKEFSFFVFSEVIAIVEFVYRGCDIDKAFEAINYHKRQHKYDADSKFYELVLAIEELLTDLKKYK